MEAVANEPTNKPAFDAGHTLSDGQYRFAIERGDGSRTEHALDVLMLRLTCKECEDAHHLEKDEHECLKPTTAFLADLAGRLTAMGVDGCSPSVAYKLWVSAPREIEALKKNTNETLNSPTGLQSAHSD